MVKDQIDVDVALNGEGKSSQFVIQLGDAKITLDFLQTKEALDALVNLVDHLDLYLNRIMDKVEED